MGVNLFESQANSVKSLPMKKAYIDSPGLSPFALKDNKIIKLTPPRLPKIEISDPDRKPVIRILTNLEQKIYYPSEQVYGMAYFEVPEGETVQSIIIQIIGKEEVVLSKWVSEKSIIGKNHIKNNPYSEVVKGKVLADEKDLNYYMNHQYCIYKHIEKLGEEEENLGHG